VGGDVVVRGDVVVGGGHNSSDLVLHAEAQPPVTTRPATPPIKRNAPRRHV
jgi:hypothetical protein